LAVNPILANSYSILSSLSSAKTAEPTVSTLVGLAVSAQLDRRAVQNSPAIQADALGTLYQKLDTLESAASPLDTTRSSDNTFADSTATATARSGIDRFVTAFNDLQAFAQAHSSEFRGGIPEALTGYAQRNRRQLADVGVTVTAAGTLEVDGTALDSALKSDFDKVKAAFGGYSGVATRSGLLASNLHATPSVELLEPLDTRTGASPALETLRESFLQGSIIDLIR
jgi:flagellar capping protein FliD